MNTKKLFFALFLLGIGGFLLFLQLKADTPRQQLTLPADGNDIEKAAAVVNQMFKAYRNRDREAVRGCWRKETSSAELAGGFRQLPVSSREFTVFDARHPDGNRNEIWLTGTVDQYGNGCTFVLVKTPGEDYRIKAVSTFEDVLTKQSPE